MPSIKEVKQYLGGQAFGETRLPEKDLSGMVFVVTGANTGLGFESVKQLASLGAAKVILACRNLEKGDRAKIAAQSFPSSTRTIFEVWQLDLGVLASILCFSERISRDLPRLDGFIANAGIEPHKFELIQDIESTISINVVSTLMVALLILPKLETTAKMYGIRTNLSIVGSMQQAFAPHVQLQVPDIFSSLSIADTADMTGRYGLSKLMVQLCTNELAQKLGDNSPVIVNVVNPGWCDTNLSEKGPIAGVIFRIIGRSAEEGARTLVHAAISGTETHGQYLSECQIKDVSDFARSEEGKASQKRLWGQLLDRIFNITGKPMQEFR